MNGFTHNMKSNHTHTGKKRNRRFCICHFVLFLLLSLLSCKEDSDLEKALAFAGENRPELEKVLAFYGQNPKDSLKLRAARFLIENMPYHHSLESPQRDSIKREIAAGIENQRSENEIYQKIKEKDLRPEGKIVYDSHVISAYYLIRNIESAFEVKEKQPWGKYVSFGDFCEYILPYRIGTEPLEDWRETYCKKYQSLLDSALASSDIIEACKIINQCNKEKSWRFVTWEGLGDSFRFGPRFLQENRMGSCVAMSDLTIYSLRSVGIPVGSEYMKVRPDHRVGHFWNFMVDTTGLSCDFSNFEADPKRNELVTFVDKKGKVYRETFSRQKYELQNRKKTEDIPPSLRTDFEIDVSERYFTLNHIEITCKNRPEKENIVYLCTFNNKGWFPVDWTEIKNGKAEFRNVDCRNIVYLPAYYRKGEIIPAGEPIIVKDAFHLNTMTGDTSRVQTLKVYRKYFDNDRFFHEIMIGGKFQVANQRNFSDAKDVFTITEFPYGFFSFRLPENTGKYRYVRYLSRDGIRGDIAELEIYGSDTTKCLQGTPIGAPSHNNDPNIDVSKAFDGDPLTCYISQYEKGAWVGLDLGKSLKISRIRFIPRGDDNSIRLGDEYELLWMSLQGWQSLGKRTADNYFLEFEKAPVDALFWLRNHTRGREERVFTYVEEKQVWW